MEEQAAPAPPGSRPDSPTQLQGGIRRLFLNAAAPTHEDSPAFQAHGFDVAQGEYDQGLTEFLSGGRWTPEGEEAYRRELDETLLVLRWLEDAPIAGDNDFRAATRARLRRTLAQTVLEHASAQDPISREELRNLYEQRNDEFRHPERVHVQIIMLPTEEQARAVVARLNGESFGAIAAAESLHESRARSGELEPFPRGTYNESFEETAFRLRPGETEVVSTGGGAFIIRKIANLPAGRIPFEQVEERLRQELRKERRAAALEEIRRKVSR